MSSLEGENRAVVSAVKLLSKSIIAAILYVTAAGFGWAQETQNHANESWKANTQTSVDNGSPSRTTESHAKAGNRSMDKLTVEVLGPNGRYQREYETEKETVQVNATMRRTVERFYRWDVNGLRSLVLLTEEEARSSASGDAQIVRTTSRSDGNGNLQVVEREVSDTTRTTSNELETKATLYLLDVNGNLAPLLQTEELETRRDDGTIDVKKTSLQQVSSGGPWRTGEVSESTIREEGKNRNNQERVALFDLNGRPSEVSRTIGSETETAAGEETSTVETYSQQVPGLAPDGNLHLNLRVTTVQKDNPDGKTIEQRLEQPNPGDPDAASEIRKTKYIVQYGVTGTLQTRTTQARDINGNWNVLSVETRKSDQAPAAERPIAPPDKAK